ncbi:MAG: type I-U CRISPR-associated protein Csb2 [Intrasporangium sp.]|uniref:type I-G CRISPR-associated protein Csb2 n=1 Tax=Intrasporangium sp. TaxID=1925024 RepID=UPI00264711F7|nr:type I-U CRISPR-associated protein Csb2 [Intrasporangium sp.]MDN5797027.1 type I-U CRISPR-associated protein Csb2 [Intrasporangium sp.]
MAVCVELRFPLGEYHATAWDRAVNSGEAEWPPSAWRILRALLSTWHLRCPALDADGVEQALALLARQPPSYRLPATSVSHTRHYLPGPEFTAVKRDTAYTLAPRVQIDPNDVVLVLWPELELDPDSRHVLGSLLKALPYLGRAESVCAARLLETHEHPDLDESWTVPADEADGLRVLVPQAGVTRRQLEVTPDAMRKARRLLPEGARWQPYRRGRPDDRHPASPHVAQPTCLRWAVGGPVAIRSINGILAAGGLRSSVLWLMHHHGTDTAHRAWSIAGPHNDRDATHRHEHAHWLWLGCPHTRRSTSVVEVALWVPHGIDQELLPSVLGVRSLAKLVEPPKGYIPAPIHLQAMGQANQVLPQLATSAKRWVSQTPLLTDRHRKQNHDPAAFVRREIVRELSFRDWPGGPVQLESCEIQGNPTDLDVKSFRRYRPNEVMSKRRPGWRVAIELDRPVRGPVALGALSHFGFGLFRPA